VGWGNDVNSGDPASEAGPRRALLLSSCAPTTLTALRSPEPHFGLPHFCLCQAFALEPFLSLHPALLRVRGHVPAVVPQPFTSRHLLKFIHSMIVRSYYVPDLGREMFMNTPGAGL
jgi:hypothetical protein